MSRFLSQQNLSLRSGEQPPKTDEVLDDDSQQAKDPSAVGNTINDTIMGSQLLTVPGVREAVLANRRGEKARVMTDTEIQQLVQQQVQAAIQQTQAQAGQQQAEPEEAEPNWAELSQAEMASRLKGLLIKEAAKSNKAIVGEALKPIQEAVNFLIDQAKVSNRNAVARTVEDAIKKYPDLPKYKDTMIEIQQANPNLGVEDLYHLAKARAGHIDPAVTQAERPTHTTARPAGTPAGRLSRPADRSTGSRQDFMNRLAGVTQGLDLSEIPD